MLKLKKVFSVCLVLLTLFLQTDRPFLAFIFLSSLAYLIANKFVY